MSEERSLLQRVQEVCNDSSIIPIKLWKSYYGDMGIFLSQEHQYKGFGLLVGEDFRDQQEGTEFDELTMQAHAKAIAAFSGVVSLPAGKEVDSDDFVSVYQQGSWIAIERPLIPDEANWFTFQGYPEKPTLILGVDELAELAVWRGPYIDSQKSSSKYPRYLYFIELVLSHVTTSFYVTDEGSYLMLLPRLIETVETALRLERTAQQFRKA